MGFEIELRCILRPLIILEIILKLDWSPQKPSHVIKGIVLQDCIEAQIWGRVRNNVCSIEGPKEHSDFHHSSMQEVWNHLDSS